MGLVEENIQDSKEMDIETLVAEIVNLSQDANDGWQNAINNDIKHLQSYYHGKDIAYLEILSLIYNGTSLLSKKEVDCIKEKINERRDKCRDAVVADRVG